MPRKREMCKPVLYFEGKPVMYKCNDNNYYVIKESNKRFTRKNREPLSHEEAFQIMFLVEKTRPGSYRIEDEEYNDFWRNKMTNAIKMDNIMQAVNKIAEEIEAEEELERDLLTKIMKAVMRYIREKGVNIEERTLTPEEIEEIKEKIINVNK